MAIAALREPRVLWIGALGIACAWFYQAPPFKLSYRGLGEIAVAVCYGPLMVVRLGRERGAGALPATAAVRRVRAGPGRTGRTIAAQAWMLAAFLLLAAGSGAGLLLAGAP